MPAPLFLLVYFSFLTTAIGNPREVGLILAGLVVAKLIR